MEISEVRKQVLRTVDRAKQHAAARQARHDEASRAFAAFLEGTAVPLMQQVANVLRSEGFPFTVFTPAGSVRLMSDRSSGDFFELLLDETADESVVVGHSTRGRGSRVVESERTIGAPDSITEPALLEFILRELEPFVER